ncbi:energy transducer TonB [Parvularcula oceani]|uniref:energy transducer TonB n=1 Tax=Parvularcula oceani TaxID=1247963 RepID=UPI0004E28591|nr:energy transducer TonB [Parvularcula oceani]
MRKGLCALVPLALLAACATTETRREAPEAVVASDWMNPVALRGPTVPASEISDAWPQRVTRWVPPEGFEHCYRTAGGGGQSVDLTFDLLASGVPANIAVASASHDCFVPYSVRALSQWRYRPALVGGERVTATGVPVVMRFDTMN